MSKLKILTYSVIILVILNLSMIVFFMVVKPREFRNHRNGPRKMIIEKLHLDKQQQEQFESLVEKHIDKIKTFDKQIQQTKESLYAQLSQPKVDVKVKDSLITSLGDLQKQIEIARFNHFKNIREICNTPEQREDFKELSVELSKMFSHRRMSHARDNQKK
ncbi:Spy/CpxP family protein refolding chaperone [Flavobacterium faecale]|uniref:Spy/CpxP family protein refolding chaperone n=1 Tax=Flavobacterium faecale TaxID=1355330 RepID=UPI003AAEBDD0